MSASDYIKQLNKLKDEVKVSPDWKSAQRDVLLSKISAQSDFSQQNLFGKLLHTHTKLAFKPVVFAMLFIIFFGSIIASVSASGSLPGEILYPIKLTTEKIQVSLVRNDSKKANLKLKLAKKRIEEIKIVAKNEKNIEKKKEILKQPVEEYKKTMQEVQNTVLHQITITNDKAQTLKLAKNLKETASDAKNTITGIIKEDTKNDVVDLLDELKNTSKKAELDAVVTIAKNVDNKEEAKKTISEYIDNIEEEKVAEKKAKVKKAKNIKMEESVGNNKNNSDNGLNTDGTDAPADAKALDGQADNGLNTQGDNADNTDAPADAKALDGQADNGDSADAPADAKALEGQVDNGLNTDAPADAKALDGQAANGGTETQTKKGDGILSDDDISEVKALIKKDDFESALVVMEKVSKDGVVNTDGTDAPAYAEASDGQADNGLNTDSTDAPADAEALDGQAESGLNTDAPAYAEASDGQADNGDSMDSTDAPADAEALDGQADNTGGGN